MSQAHDVKILGRWVRIDRSPRGYVIAHVVADDDFSHTEEMSPETKAQLSNSSIAEWTAEMNRLEALCLAAIRARLKEMTP